jgi:hypothetical protein
MSEEVTLGSLNEKLTTALNEIGAIKAAVGSILNKPSAPSGGGGKGFSKKKASPPGTTEVIKDKIVKVYVDEKDGQYGPYTKYTAVLGNGKRFSTLDAGIGQQAIDVEGGGAVALTVGENAKGYPELYAVS